MARDRPRRQLSRATMAEGEELKSNALQRTRSSPSRIPAKAETTKGRLHRMMTWRVSILIEARFACRVILPRRQTGVVAKQVAEVDILSGGRVRLGVAVSWNHVE
jgi:hypothetical protein